MRVKKYQFSIQADVTQIDVMCDFVTQVVRECGFSEDVIHRCHLMIDEICINVIEHGYQYQTGASIEAVCWVLPNRLSITITDDAQPFNPLNHQDPDPHCSLEERIYGGWGIYFVKQYVDSVYYAYRNQRNHLTIEKRFDANCLPASR
jgi:anti-sigma regulatory factor (Ser/Thr protein kinase)